MSMACAKVFDKIAESKLAVQAAKGEAYVSDSTINSKISDSIRDMENRFGSVASAANPCYNYMSAIHAYAAQVEAIHL